MKGMFRTLGRSPKNQSAMRVINIPVRGVPVTITDPGAAVAWGTKVLGGLPGGNLLLLGVVAYLKLSSSSAGLGATYNATVALGTAATADATLSGSEVDLVAAAALGAATAKVSPLGRLVHPAANTGNVIDNTDNSKAVNLNITVPDADITATSSVTVTGYVSLAVIVLGDD